MQNISYSTKLQNFINWASKTKNLLTDEQDTPINSCTLIDIKLKRRDEDEVFLTDDEVFKKIRRGNCVISYKVQGGENYKMGRKGLRKFFDYKIQYKGKGDDRRMKKRVLEPIKEAFDKGKQVKVYLTKKENGENVQIAYEENYNAWIIGSKNVSMLCRNKDDIQWYLFKSQSGEKYSFCIEFAELWFDILEKKIIANGKLQEFINDIKGYTLVGENINKDKHQHIKLYAENGIIFYAMIKNEASEDNPLEDQLCIPLLTSRDLLTKYGLSYVDTTVSPLLKDFDEFKEYMNQQYNEVLRKDIDSSGEGSVAYFSSVDPETNEEEIVGMGKLKTFEYRFLRKLREKLKGFKKKASNNPSNIINAIEKECKELLGEEGDDINLTEYLKFGKFVLNHVYNISGEDVFNLYASFIHDMKEMYNIGAKIDLDLDKENKVVDNEEEIKTKHKSKNKKTKEIKNQSSPDESDEESNHPCFIKGKVYFLLNFGLVAGGKSTLLSLLQTVIEKNYNDSINLMYISSDQFRRALMDNYFSTHKKATFEEAHSKTDSAYRNNFDNAIVKMLRNNKDDDKVNIMYIDKNFSPDTAKKFYSEMKTQYDKKANFEITIFHPKMDHHIHEGSLIYPFSWSYFIQSYHRLRLRKDHESLDFEKCPHAHYILLSFLQLFRKVSDFEKDKNFNLYPITFTDERELEVPEDISKLFKQIMNGIGKKPFDTEHISQFDDLIEKFFELIVEKFPSTDFMDTRKIMFEEIKEFIDTRMHKHKLYN